MKLTVAGGLRIRDLKVGDRVSVIWSVGQTPTVGTVSWVQPNASRGSGTLMKTDAGQYVRLKACMGITRVEP
jgi:hypothetical protein